MAKSLEQVVLAGLASDCYSLEELYVLWQTMQHAEQESVSDTGYPEIDQRSFHLDGVMNPREFMGVLYILKEPSLKQYIQKGLTFPVITDIRKEYQKYKRENADECAYLASMQEILLGDMAASMTDSQIMDTLAVLYVNKRGGKESQDGVWLNYGYEYLELIKRQIHLIGAKVIVCGGEEVFRFIIKEVFAHKKSRRGRSEPAGWPAAADQNLFTADAGYCYTDDPKKTAFIVVNMWDPADGADRDKYSGLEEYLDEFVRRVRGMDKV